MYLGSHDEMRCEYHTSPFDHRRPKLISRVKPGLEIKINSRKRMYLFMKASRVVWRGVGLREELLKIWTLYTRNRMLYGKRNKDDSLTCITVMAKQTQNDRGRQKPQRAHKEWVIFIKLTLNVSWNVKCSYFAIFGVVNRLYFVPHTIPYNEFKFSTVPRGN